MYDRKVIGSKALPVQLTHSALEIASKYILAVIT